MFILIIKNDLCLCIVYFTNRQSSNKWQSCIFMCIQVVDRSSSVFPCRCGSGSQASVKYFRDTRTKSDASLCSPTQQTTSDCCPGPSTIPWRWNSHTLCTFNSSIKSSCKQCVLSSLSGVGRRERNKAARPGRSSGSHSVLSRLTRQMSFCDHLCWQDR